MQIEELETQMAEMQQSSAVLSEAESSLRQQVSGLQVRPAQIHAYQGFLLGSVPTPYHCIQMLPAECVA